MKVDVLASGSKGNCVVLRTDQSTILIDVGVAKRDIKSKLLEHDIRPDKVDAIFITHAHGDHIKGVTLANDFKIPVYATAGEFERLHKVDEDLRRVVGQVENKYVYIHINNDITVYPFRTYHNSEEPVGYAIEDQDNKRCSVVFDTGHVDQNMLNHMKGSIYVIEANHDLGMLKRSNREIALKERIVSDYAGHLSNTQTGQALKELIEGKGERIYLTHLSSEANLSLIAQMTVERYLSPLTNGKDYYLEVVR